LTLLGEDEPRLGDGWVLGETILLGADDGITLGDGTIEGDGDAVLLQLQKQSHMKLFIVLFGYTSP
jgi:hypothetical protein